jgi:hypothetical protein
MMPYLKKDAPLELVESVRQIEERADACAAELALFKTHSNLALWALLVGGIRRAEQAMEVYGANSPDFDHVLINTSRGIPIAMKWVNKSAKPASRLAQRHWTSTLAAKTDEAFFIADQYNGFLSCLPMWHRNRYLAELRSSTLVRLTASGSSRERQVSAHLKGLRPTTGPWKGLRGTTMEVAPRVQQHFASVLEKCRKTGSLRFECDDPWGLWSELPPQYQARVNDITRRADSLSLGSYTLGQFKCFYAGLLTICAAHDLLCFRWRQASGNYPLDSAVIVRSMASWVNVLSELSGLSPDVCRAAISDLTFDFTRSVDLHVHPFIPLDRSTMRIAIAPQFPLRSLPDENILRVCSQLRPSSFDATTGEKQPEMLDTLHRRCKKFSLQGPVPLPPPHADIDIIVTDEGSSTIILAEMKWIRKTLRPVEFKDRDADVLKGITQLEGIRAFLAANPEHLRSLGKLPKRVSEYRNVHYFLIARDHWVWAEPNRDIAIVEFEAFSSALVRSETLQSAARDLLSYDWLPIEGRDFTVNYDRVTVNGVSLEAEVFYPPIF